MKECFHKGSDNQFDHLISTLANVSENCLPSILKSLFSWYDHQLNAKLNLGDTLEERKELVVSSILCIVLIEILNQVEF